MGIPLTPIRPSREMWSTRLEHRPCEVGLGPLIYMCIYHTSLSFHYVLLLLLLLLFALFTRGDRIDFRGTRTNEGRSFGLAFFFISKGSRMQFRIIWKDLLERVTSGSAIYERVKYQEKWNIYLFFFWKVLFRSSLSWLKSVLKNALRLMIVGFQWFERFSWCVNNFEFISKPKLKHRPWMNFAKMTYNMKTDEFGG